MNTVKEKFHIEKRNEVERLFNGKKYQKWFVYSQRIFRGEQEKPFLKKVKNLDVKAISFEKILEETIEDMNHYSVDSTRIFLYYAKFFLSKK